MLHMAKFLGLMRTSNACFIHIDQNGVLATNNPTLYPSCTWHSDCGEEQFCGVKCWTGGCDEGNDDRKGKKRGRFCQPCTKCKKHPDSVTRSCEVCKVSGNLLES